MSVLDDLQRGLDFFKEREVEKVSMPKEVYDTIDPELIADTELRYNCKIVPVVHKVSKPKREVRNQCFKPQDAMRFHKRGHKHKR